MSIAAIPPAVIADQHAASDPGTSAWVSANAGSGKTHVLAQRVIRLLLDGTPPAKILCLTFTKAAAANMANRIFDTLSKWVKLDDAALDSAIRDTGARDTGPQRRAQARRLFASALETPGGLKVQTIHGFCTRLLQQFPLEANVAARFRVLEDTQQTQLLEDIRRDVLLDAARQPHSAVGRALEAIIPVASDFVFQIALNEAIRERTAISDWIDQAGDLDAAAAQLSAAVGIKITDTLASVETEIVEGPHLPSGQWASAASICAQSSKADQGHGVKLTGALAAVGATRIDAYTSVFLTADFQPRSRLLTGAFAKANPDLARRFTDEQARMPALCEKRRAVLTRDRTMALMAVALDVTNRYGAEKNRRGLLDYDDLITHTRALLERVESAWVHFKLDLGIDHLLIDEAQDTSPQQWNIIKRFVAEFTAGAGARGPLRRSIFAVGDDKQSIFSFQDARPEAFDEMHKFFKAAHEDAGLPFSPIPLNYSFRSAPVVLDAVDEVFKQPAAHAGLTVVPRGTAHSAVRAAAPGLVEIWPLVEPDDKPEIDPWDAPFDKSSETSPRVKLARQIAGAVKTWIDRGDMVGDGDKRHGVRAGDMLILVRQRGALFEAVIRALKAIGVPVAGADRLLLTDHIAIMDLLVLADAILLPTHDLALATVLKSPLFGLTEQELFELAHGRKRSLRATLRERRPEHAARLDALGDAARRLTPFSFYAELLGPHGGRKAFLSRLGAEANDALDEFLNLALDYESRETPSLQGFVAWLRTASAEVKRDMEMERNEVRVMTVHGAKGLEAPIVILADTTTVPAGPTQYQPRLLPIAARNAPPGTPDRIAWLRNKKDDTEITAAARNAAILANENEYRRLLYVAMTRAADRLIICGSIGEKVAPPGCWYELVEQGLSCSGLLVEEAGDVGDSRVMRYRKGSAEAAAAQPPKPEAPQLSLLPPWLSRKVTKTRSPDPIKPSGFVDDREAGELPERREARRRAILRGNIVHRLMQSLPDIPPERRVEAARRHIVRQGTDFSDVERDAIAASALALLDDPRFAALFSAGSRAEVPIVGRIGDRLVNGVVDRLLVAPDAVRIADYKTNRQVPKDLAETQTRYPGYITQLALYGAVLKRLYPDRPIRAALVWTAVPTLLEIPPEALDAALAGLTRA
jgi:ATP-dependent helicase/nuclease subunit A